MDDFWKLFESLGYLHDSVVERLTWTPEAGTLELAIEDFYSNFDGLPEYPGRLAGSITLRGIETIDLDIDFGAERLNIDEFVVESDPSGVLILQLKFWPRGRIDAKFGSIDLPQLVVPGQVDR